MIKKFGPETALLLIDIQKGVDVLEYWGGATGRRNNPDAETRLRRLLEAWREHQYPVFFTLHNSREQNSPLKLSLETGQPKEGFEPETGEIVVTKDVNGGFIGTSLEIQLRRAGVSRLLIAGFFTNMCVETTTRHAGNLGFDTYLVENACAATNRIGPDGSDHDPETVHTLSVASLNGEFCTAISCEDALSLLKSDHQTLRRVQGNE